MKISNYEKSAFLSGVCLGILLGLFVLTPLLSWLNYRSAVKQRAESERMVYCAVWQSDNLLTCMAGK